MEKVISKPLWSFLSLPSWHCREEKARTKILPLWNQRKFSPGKFLKKGVRRPQPVTEWLWGNCSCDLCEAQHISTLVSLCAKISGPKISLINDTVKCLSRISRVHHPLFFFRKLVRTSRVTTSKFAQVTKDIYFEELREVIGPWLL